MKKDLAEKEYQVQKIRGMKRKNNLYPFSLIEIDRNYKSI